MTKYLVSPSILAGDFANMERSVRSLKEWGADLVHCDVMDGVYVKNITFGMPMIKAIKGISELPLDVHLMIVKPERYVEEFCDCGASYITFHPEVSDDPLNTLKTIKSKGVKAGIVLNPNVPFENWSSLLSECDLLLVMSVYAGLGGQKFINETLETVKKAKAYIAENNLSTLIEIDGGVNEENAKEIRDAGVDILVAGSSVYKSTDPTRTIKMLRGE